MATLQVAPHDEGKMLLNMGPQHPSTHGVINLLVETDGEVIDRATPEIGYLHRGIEKIGERIPYTGFMPYTDRVDYVAAMLANEVFAGCVEKLMNIEVPKKASYCRMIAGELCRIASHFVATGTMIMDIGAYTPFMHWLRERETINDLLEELCGARLTYNYHRIGGVMADVTPGWIAKVKRYVDHLEPLIDEFDRLISGNKIFIERTKDVAVITGPQAIDYGFVGPNLRASGVDWDLRRDVPYSAYSDVAFEVPVGKGVHGTVGDCFDRYDVRMQEIRESIKIVRQACDGMPTGPFLGKVPKKVKPPKGSDAYFGVESARGEMGCYIWSDGTDKPGRIKFRTGSFSAMTIFEDFSPGLMIADLVALIASLDVVAPEIDR